MFLSLKRYFGWRTAPSLAFVATVALAYVGSFWTGELRLARTRDAWCLALGVGYAGLGLIDFSSLYHRSRRGGTVLYLCVQGSLLLGIFWAGRLSGDTPACVFPLVAVTVGLLGPRAAVAGLASLYAMTLAVEGHFYGRVAAEHWAISMISGYGFVILFTLMALRAIAARLRVETLSAEVEKLAVIKERNRLAGEIHDSLGHFLTTIHVQLEAARAIHASDPGRALAAVAQAQDLARDALVEVRRSVGTLQADRVIAPLVVRLRELASATDGWGAAVSLEILGEVRALAPETEHALFRAAQEGLTNVRKHARARTAQVRLDYRAPARVFICVTDDGCGAAAGPAGHGLAGLRERISSLGGCVVADRPAGGGFQLQVEIPA